jgi:hypothetical protein
LIKRTVFKFNFKYVTLLILSCFILITPGCKKDNSHRTLAEMVKHIQDSGIKITTISPLIPAPVKAERGVALKIGDRQIGIYKYDLKKVKMKEKLERVTKEGYVYIVGRKFPVKINGCFILTDFNIHKQAREIVEAFDSFE